MTKKSGKLDKQVEQMNDDGPTMSAPYEVELETHSASVRRSSKAKSYRLDLRISSPSALGYLGIDGIDTAPALIRLAKVKGIDVIAVTDYHSAAYVDRLVAASRETAVTVLPGVLLRTQLPICNDINLMCLFPESLSSIEINQILNQLKVPKSAAGNSNYIIDLDFAEVISILESHQALIVPSRMDKTPYQRQALPVLVEQYGFRAFDLAYHPESIEFFKKNWPKIKFNLLSFSNANALAQVGSRVSKVRMSNPGFIGLTSVVGRSTTV